MKERLTGAIILVALIVLLVPELLTGPATAVRVGKAPGPSVAAGPIAAGSSVRSYTLPLEAPGKTRAGAITWPAAASRPASLAIPSTTSGTTRQPQARATLPQTPVAPARTRAQPPLRRETAAVSGPRTAPLAARNASRSRSRARWAVQVGVFAVHGDALRMQRRVGALGIPSRIGRMSLRGRLLWRVTAGPVNGAAAGQALARRLRAHGIKGELRPN